VILSGTKMVESLCAEYPFLKKSMFVSANMHVYFVNVLCYILF